MKYILVIMLLLLSGCGFRDTEPNREEVIVRSVQQVSRFHFNRLQVQDRNGFWYIVSSDPIDKNNIVQPFGFYTTNIYYKGQKLYLGRL